MRVDWLIAMAASFVGGLWPGAVLVFRPDRPQFRTLGVHGMRRAAFAEPDGRAAAVLLNELDAGLFVL